MTEVIINGPEGRLEARYHHTKNINAPIALILHSHPEHGGTMNNNVTYALYKTFINRGFNTMRFNFRGIGKSEGTFSQGENELSDAAAILDWMQTYNTNASTCWVAGFSFGGWIAMQLLMRRPELEGFISVGTPASLYDFSFLAPCPTSGVFIHGKTDRIINPQAVEDLAHRLSSQKNIYIETRFIDNADHFFNDKLSDVVSHADDYLVNALKNRRTKLTSSRR